MNASTIENISVVGAGQMGSQIAMLFSLKGYWTTLQDRDNNALQQAEISLEKRMNEWVEKGKITEVKKKEAMARLSYKQDLNEAVQNADLIIEAIVEQLEFKRELFRQLDQLAPAHTILATNSSTIVNSLLSEVTGRPGKVCNMHFFFPPLVMECVEVVMSDQTTEETADTVLAVCEQIGRKGILLRKEISGFVANRVLGAIHREATYIYEQGIADFKDIDFIVKNSLGHKLGPFELIDLSGADVVYSVMQHQFSESGDLRDLPAACIRKKVEKGELGRKTGIGFYEYREEKVKY